MIQIKNANKYFNKRKSNEIHVINETSLDFPSTGLVCLLGASGSGKTTLLNVVGGLDKIDSGEITFKDYSIKKYKASKWDNLRNRHFGYIFQNYILLPDLTVYQNLELVLKILNLSKEEIDQRIDYALDAVGMLKFKKRKPTQLSGGQQQRVAIARALVKSPDVVIADEPTGNLDEKNTTQIMSIIKKISKECLVILVTHERRLAEFYGDRIIEIADGKVFKDVQVTSTNDFQELDNNNIYLQEFKKEEATIEDIKVKYFYKDERNKLDLNIIFKDNIFYIQSPGENVKIKFLDKANEIKVIDSKKPIISKQHIDEFDYHLPKIEHKTNNKDSVIKFTDTIKMAFRHLGGLRKRQKILFVVMCLSAIMITIGFINLFSSSHVDEKDFLNFNRNLLVADMEYDDLVAKIGDEDMILHQPNTTFISFLGNGYFDNAKSIQLRELSANLSFTNSVIPLSVIQNPKIVMGRLPEKSREALIDKYLVDMYLDYGTFSSAGIKYQEQFIGLTFSQNEFKEEASDLFTIVGIVDNNNPNFYISENDYKTSFVIQNIGIYQLQILQTNVLESRTYTKIDSTGKNTGEVVEEIPVLEDNQILVNAYYYESFMKNNSTNMITIGYDGKRTLEVIGFITPKDFEALKIYEFYVNNSFVDNYYEELIKDQYSYNNMVVFSHNPEEFIEKLKIDGAKVESLYDQEYNRLKLQTMNLDLFISSIVVLSASLVFLYFLMRSSMMSRIYQIGVYRALGIRKSNIYRIFFTEILIITLITAIIGIFLVSIVVNNVNAIIEVIYYPWFIAPISLLFIFIVNAIVGLLPVNTLLRLTPSQILSKYDI